MHNDISVNRGYLYIIGGLIILLYVLGFISKVLNIILVIIAFGLVGYGLYRVGIYHAIKNRLTKK